jgi:D-alanyl-D-alanine carboxypeptidase
MARLGLTRELVGIVCVWGWAGALLLAACPNAAVAHDRYAAIVVDANSTNVLYERNADAYRYPASLTKMMTLYLTFEALEKGTLTLDQALSVSSRATYQAPSKLELKISDTITVDQAIRAVVTKSANDAAVVLAEAIAVEEHAFARVMTDKAAALGMSRTTFRNASGLPNPKQRTTARDLSTLGVALKRDFPQYFSYFSTPSFSWAGATFPNHDKLLTAYEGTTGLKTGYTAASGFNLATSVTRDGHDLVAVVMGGRTARARDDHMMQLLDLQFARLRGGPVVADSGTDKPQAVAALADPRQRPAAVASQGPSRMGVGKPTRVGATPRPRPEAARVMQASLGADPIGETIAVLTAASATPPSAGVAKPAQFAALNASEGDTDEGDPKPQIDAKDASVINWLDGNHSWGIQIGAFVAMESAAARLSAAAALAPERLAKATPAILPSPNGSSTLYRARFGPFDQAEAQAACDMLSERGISCTPVHDAN